MTRRRDPAPRVVPADMARDLCAKLAPMQRATMLLVAQGYSGKEIARLRDLKTVERTRCRALEILGALNTAHAVVIVAKAGLV